MLVRELRGGRGGGVGWLLQQTFIKILPGCGGWLVLFYIAIDEMEKYFLLVIRQEKIGRNFVELFIRVS